MIIENIAGEILQTLDSLISLQSQEVIDDDTKAEILMLEHVLKSNLNKFKAKADAFANVIRILAKNEDICKEEIKRVTERAKHWKKQREYLKYRLLDIMDVLGLPNYKTELNTFYKKTSHSIEIIDESEIPDDFIREKIVREPDKIKIKEEIKNNGSVSGTKLTSKISLQLK